MITVPDYATLFQRIAEYETCKTIKAEAEDELPSIYSTLRCINLDKINQKLWELQDSIIVEKEKDAHVVGLFLVVDSMTAI